MPFPYTFPFVFDNVLTASDDGVGAESGFSLTLISLEAGSGLENAPDKAAQSVENGGAADALKALVRKSGPVADLRLYETGRAGWPSRQVNKSSRRVNL